MAQDLVINGETYEGVERLAAKNTEGGVVVYTEGGGGGGISPTISVAVISGGHRVTITDITGTKSFDVMDGETGPAGKDGVSGAAGEDGVSPIVSVATIAGGHRVTITDANGTKYFDVMDGKNGSGEGGGADGEDGVTFYPNVDAAGNLSWTNDGGLTNPDPVNIMGPQGPAGKDGSAGQPGVSGSDGVDGVTPHIGANGNWYSGETDTGTPATGPQGPAGADGQPGAAGKDATINGANALTLTTGTGLNGSQSGNTYTLSLASHNQAASTVTAGTFAGQVVAKSGAQTPGTMLLRNSILSSADDKEIQNGEIIWIYE